MFLRMDIGLQSITTNTRPRRGITHVEDLYATDARPMIWITSTAATSSSTQMPDAQERLANLIHSHIHVSIHGPGDVRRPCRRSPWTTLREQPAGRDEGCHTARLSLTTIPDPLTSSFAGHLGKKLTGESYYVKRNIVIHSAADPVFSIVHVTVVQRS